MKFLMDQWEHRKTLREVEGKDLFDILKLIERTDEGYTLKHPENVTSAILLSAHTESIYRKLETSEEECEKEYKNRITKLHRYNKIKDAAQHLIGLIAQAKGISVKEVSEEYDAPDE